MKVRKSEEGAKGAKKTYHNVSQWAVESPRVSVVVSHHSVDFPLVVA